MKVNSVVFKFADCPKLADKFKELGFGGISIEGTKIHAVDGQLAIQFFNDLRVPTPGQKEEFQKIVNMLKVFGDLFADLKVE